MPSARRGKGAAPNPGRVRAAGGGRKKLVAKDATLLRDLDALVEPTTRGDPQSALRWTCKSTTRLARELNRQGHPVSQRTVCDLLAQLYCSLQSTRKTRQGSQHPDRDAQFRHIAAMVEQYRVRLWRLHLQKLADELQLAIQVCHFPPGTSKWNKIEHRMFWQCNRHTFASRLVMAGVDIRTVAQLMGHSTIQMSMRYARLAPEHNSATIERLVGFKTPGRAESSDRVMTKSVTGKSRRPRKSLKPA